MFSLHLLNESCNFSMVVAVVQLLAMCIHQLGMGINKDEVHFAIQWASVVNMNSIPWLSLPFPWM